MSFKKIGIIKDVNFAGSINGRGQRKFAYISKLILSIFILS